MARYVKEYDYALWEGTIFRLVVIEMHSYDNIMRSMYSTGI
jgi:hypothetical protein